MTTPRRDHPARVAGTAEFDTSCATARSVLLLALAGPAASTGVGVFGVLNRVPLTLHERRDGPVVQTDGRLALDALRIARALS